MNFKKWQVYIWLMLVSIVICISSIFISECTVIFTIISGVSGGAFASTIVALLIDWQNTRENNKKKEYLQKIILYPMKTTMHTMIFNFGRLACELDNNISKDDQKEWDDWAKILQDKLAECNDAFSLQRAFVSLDASLNNYCNRMHEFRSCKFKLIYNELIKTSEYYALAEVEYFANVMRNSIATRTQLEVANQAFPNLINAIRENKNELLEFINLDDLQMTGFSFAEHLNNTDNRTWI